MKKLIFLLALLALALPAFGINARDIQWWSQTSYTNTPANTLKQWCESMEGRAALQPGTGNIYYVDSGVAAEGDGSSWVKAKDDIDAAIGLCTASNGDIILVAPGHNEGISSAAAINCDVEGITIIGLGMGDLKPTIDYDNAAGSVQITADNVTLVNLRFRVSANATVVGVNVLDGYNYASILGCDFGWAETATDEFATAIRLDDASNYATIEDCWFNAGAQAAVSAIDFNEDTSFTKVRRNLFEGNYSTAPVLGATTASTNLVITDNIFLDGGTATDTFNLVAASTGIVAHNLIRMNAASAAAALDVGNCLCFQNFLIAHDDVGGTKGAVMDTTFASITATADD